MPLDKAKKVIDLLADLNVKACTFLGGEPTLYEYLPEIIAYAATKQVGPGVVTNGRRLKEKALCVELIDSGLAQLSISLEGLDAASHERVTQVDGSYQDTVKAIENFRSLNYRIHVITTICKSNAPDLRKMVDRLVEYGASNAVFNICTPSITGEMFPEIIAPHELGPILDDIMTYRQTEISTSVVTPFPPCLQLKTELHSRSGTCQMFLGNGLTIDVAGDVLPCTHFSKAPLFNVFQSDGVMSATDFLHKWDDEGKSFRESLWSYPGEKCSTCEHWNRCFGACPLFWTKFSLDDEQKKLASNWM